MNNDTKDCERVAKNTPNAILGCHATHTAYRTYCTLLQDALKTELVHSLSAEEARHRLKCFVSGLQHSLTLSRVQSRMIGDGLDAYKELLRLKEEELAAKRATLQRLTCLGDTIDVRREQLMQWMRPLNNSETLKIAVTLWLKRIESSDREFFEIVCARGQLTVAEAIVLGLQHSTTTGESWATILVKDCFQAASEEIKNKMNVVAQEIESVQQQSQTQLEKYLYTAKKVAEVNDILSTIADVTTKARLLIKEIDYVEGVESDS